MNHSLAKHDDIYEQAQKRVKAKKGFISHLIAYTFTLLMLYYIICVAGNGPLVPVVIVALSWGIGLASHYLSAFGTQSLEFLGMKSEEEELEDELEKLRYKRQLKQEIRQEKLNLEDLDRLELKELDKRELDKRELDRDF